MQKVVANSKRVRSERVECPIRTLLEDQVGTTDKFVRLVQTELDPGWWLVDVFSSEKGSGGDPAWDAMPFEIKVRWTSAGGAGNGFIATVSTSERFTVYATSLIIEARNTAFAAIAEVAVSVAPVGSYSPAEMLYEAPYNAQAFKFVLIPRFAKRFRVELDDPAAVGTTTVRLFTAALANGPRVLFNLADQPDHGWLIGNCKTLQVAFAGPTCKFRVVFELEV